MYFIEKTVRKYSMTQQPEYPQSSFPLSKGYHRGLNGSHQNLNSSSSPRASEIFPANRPYLFINCKLQAFVSFPLPDPAQPT